MPSIPTEALSAIGAVFAALIAALISLLGLIISKEHKVSDFRQAWNDGLREDIALIISHIECLRGVAHAHLPNRAPWAERKDHFIALNRAIVAVQLRLEPERQIAQELLSKLDDLSNAAQGGDIGTSDLLGPAVDAVVVASRNVIRQEWSLIRRGEGVFLWTRYASVAIVIAAALGLAILVPTWIKTANAKNVNDKAKVSSAAVAPDTKVMVYVCGQNPSNGASIKELRRSGSSKRSRHNRPDPQNVMEPCLQLNPGHPPR